MVPISHTAAGAPFQVAVVGPMLLSGLGQGLAFGPLTAAQARVSGG
ncbi:hypothetical protein [Arthrobacter glacialis]|nr:hypothetical protein [Arthrobacter glacialis]